MGVRFACHACGKRLNIKTELAGRRGICPTCSVRFRIPAYDSESSIPLEVDDPGSSIGSQAAPASVAERSGGVAVRSQPTRTSVAHPQPSSPESQGSAGHQSGTNGQQASKVSAIESTTKPVLPDPKATSASREQVLGGATATWYVRPPSGGQYGPADGPTMGQWIQEGRVADLAMVWRDGWTDWQVAKDAIPGITPNTTPAEITPVNDDSARPAKLADPVEAVVSDEVTPRPGLLDSNKKKRSQKRIVMSIVLATIFLGLVVAFVLVLKS